MYTNSNFDPRLCLATGEATTSADDSADRADVCSWQAGRNATFQLHKDELSKGLVSDAGDGGYTTRVASRIRKIPKCFLPYGMVSGKGAARLKAASLNHVVRLGVPVSFGWVMQGALVIDRAGCRESLFAFSCAKTVLRSSSHNAFRPSKQ